MTPVLTWVEWRDRGRLRSDLRKYANDWDGQMVGCDRCGLRDDRCRLLFGQANSLHRVGFDRPVDYRPVGDGRGDGNLVFEAKSLHHSRSKIRQAAPRSGGVKDADNVHFGDSGAYGFPHVKLK